VIVVGGGYGGVATAKALDDIADVVLIEPKDAFVHNIAALRALVDPEWTDRIFYPYRHLLSRGRVIHDRAVHVEADAVTIGSGERIEADYIVLASGSAYPFRPRWMWTTRPPQIKDRRTRAELIKAERVCCSAPGRSG
jgi:NADH dehydrogenase FAD-containing subunit